jgi:hypothetical protein
MPGTGERGSGNSRPGDLTRVRQQQLLKTKAAREDAASIDLGEIRRAALREGIDVGWGRGWDAGFAAALQQLRDAGLDVDAVLALDDDSEDAE